MQIELKNEITILNLESSPKTEVRVQLIFMNPVRILELKNIVGVYNVKEFNPKFSSKIRKS